MVRHYNIPFFIPELACPYRCIYCNQCTISGVTDQPHPAEVSKKINSYLQTIPQNHSIVEVAFFGGSFTGLPIAIQNQYLKEVKPFIDNGLINGIRISTRPDYIDDETTENLVKHHVTAVELGAQSTDNGVLALSKRGHGFQEIANATHILKKFGLETGLQMMTGLPGDTKYKALKTAEDIINLKADTTRIYPTLVLKNTELADLYLNNQYQPQPLDEAIELSAILFEKFRPAGVRVLKTGLHPSENYYDNETLLDGPFHPAFGELVQSKIWSIRFHSEIPFDSDYNKLIIKVNKTRLNAAIGHRSVNKKELQKSFKSVEFVIEQGLANDEFDYTLEKQVCSKILSHSQKRPEVPFTNNKVL